MTTGICAGFGELIGAATLAALNARGVGLVRQDGRIGGWQILTPDECTDLAQEVLDAGLQCLFVAHTFDQIRALPDGVQVEWRNEPDIEGPVPVAYGAEIEIAAKIAGHRGLKLWVGGISNPHARGRAYLEALRPVIAGLPPSVGVTWHRYPVGTSNSPHTPHAGFKTRDDEVAYIRHLIGDRAWAISECGYHTAGRSVGWWLWKRTLRWTDADVALYTSHDLNFYRQHGAEFSVVYQLNDAVPDTRLSRYGIRRVDGSWKPVADALR